MRILEGTVSNLRVWGIICSEYTDHWRKTTKEKKVVRIWGQNKRAAPQQKSWLRLWKFTWQKRLKRLIVCN